MAQWLRMGKVKEAHGLRGDLWVILFAKEAPWLEQVTEFALAAGDEGPFEIFQFQKGRFQKDGLVLTTNEITDRTQAEAKEGLLFYLPEELFRAEKGDTIYLRDVLGFSVKDQDKEIGTIAGFSSNGPQDLLLVKNESETYEIPFVEAFLKKIDFENRVVWMELPEGLLELK